MIHKVKLTLVLSAIALVAGAQNEETKPQGNSRYFGIQGNQLVRQLFNLGSNAASPFTPYLLTYSIINNSTGTSLALGLGYTYNQFNDGDAITPRQTTESAFFFRMGIEKKIYWGKHWLVGYGVDVVTDRESEKTNTNFQGGGPVETQTITGRVGLGPRFTFNYVITDKIIVGTEASYYFKSATEKIKNPTFPTRTENKFKSFNLAVPSVIYLILKI